LEVVGFGFIYLYCFLADGGEVGHSES
jgi:hypothetical protein